LFPSISAISSKPLYLSAFSSKPLVSQLLRLFFKVALFPASLPFLKSVFSQLLRLFFKAAFFPASLPFTQSCSIFQPFLQLFSQLFRLLFKAALSQPFLQNRSLPSFSAFSSKLLSSQLIC
jgi:hypothetical protein